MTSYDLYDDYIVEELADNAFKHQAPDAGPLPSFDAARDLLPEPHWGGHDSAVDCYWRAWQIAFANLKQPTEENGFVSRYIDTAFNDNTFMWDSTFMMFFGVYGHRVFPFIGTLDNFYRKQHRDGYICREIRESDGSDCFGRHDPSGTGPNIMAWAEWQHYQTYADRDRLAKVFPALLAYYRWFRYNLSWPDGTYYSTGWGCGMDNQPRFAASDHVHLRHEFLSWIDTSFQQLFVAGLLTKMAEALGRQSEVGDLEAERERLAPLLNQYCWDESAGFFFDRDRDGQTTGVKTVGAFWALLAGSVDRARIERMVAHLSDPKTFKSPHRVPSLGKDHPNYVDTGEYWRGGVWPPTNYMVLNGLTRQGQDALAHEIAREHHGEVVKVFEQTGTVWENYAPERSEPGKPAKKDFVGWSGVPPISVLFEYVFGLRPDAAAGRLLWDVRLCEAHGVKRYPFGKATTLELHCDARSAATDRPKVQITSNQPLEVELRWQGGSELLNIQP